MTLTVTYPSALPDEAVYWKYGRTPDQIDTHWYQLPTSVTGTTATFFIADGQLGDDDLPADGRIADPGGSTISSEPVAEIPKLSK